MQAEAAGLADQVQEIGGKKAFKVEMTKKDQKKLMKGFEGLTFDADNACELPEAGAKTLMGIHGAKANLKADYPTRQPVLRRFPGTAFGRQVQRISRISIRRTDRIDSASWFCRPI